MPSFDHTGPQVTAPPLPAASAPGLSQFTLAFSEPIDGATLRTSQIAITGPGGAIAVDWFKRVDATHYTVAFPAQSAPREMIQRFFGGSLGARNEGLEHEAQFSGKGQKRRRKKILN